MYVIYLDKDNGVISEDKYKACKEGTASLSALEVANIRAAAIACQATEGQRVIVSELSAIDFLAAEAKAIEEAKVAAELAAKKAADDIAAAAARDVTE